jgi:hypothetical protein
MKRLIIYVICIILLVIIWFIWHSIMPIQLSCDVDILGCDVSEGIPKKIWTFWNSDVIPTMVGRCVASWRKHCPDYQITILTPSTLCHAIDNSEEVLTLPFSDTPQRLADFVRLHVLHKHGGFWADASIIMFQSLDVLVENQRKTHSEYVGYYIDKFTVSKRYPVIENWFFGCVRHSRFIGRWKNEFMRINNYRTAASYVDHIRMHNIDISGIPRLLSYYLTMHVAAQVVLQHNPFPIEKIYLQIAESTHGPLGYLEKCSWDTRKAVRSLIDMDRTNVLFVKLRGAERKYLASDDELLEILLPLQ